MANIYSDEEKQMHLNQYVSDQQKDVLKPQVISYKIGLNLRLLMFILFFKTNFFIFTLKI